MTTSGQSARPRRGCLFFLGRGLLVLLILLVALPLTGFVYETIMQAGDAERYPPPGQLETVEGHVMHMICLGEGSPTVILEQGAGGFAVQHAALQDQLRQDTRVCAYDRAGMGWSEPRPEARTAWQIAYELHTLLGNAGIEPPYVMVGPSNGGLYVRAFAAEYPDETVGLVLLDPTYEGDLAGGQNLPTGFYIFLGRTGVFRLTSGAACPACSPEGAAAMAAQRGRAVIWETYDAEWQALRAPDEIALMSERLGQPGTLGDTPLIVIAANQAGVPLQAIDDAIYWAGLEEERTATIMLSTNYRYHTVMSDHGLSDQSELIILSIRDVLASVHTGEPLGE